MRHTHLARRRRKRLWIPIAAVLVAAAAAGLFFSRFTFLDGSLLRRDVTELDLRGVDWTESRYAKAAERFPDAHIRRSVVLSGTEYDSDSAEIRTGDLSVTDAEKLTLFSDLRRVDVSECSDPATVERIRAVLPDAEVVWYKELGGETLAWDTTDVTVRSPDAEELTGQLQWFPAMKTVTAEGTLSPAGQLALLKEYPEIEFHWNVDLCGKSFAQNTEEIDLAGIALTAAELEENEPYLALFPELKTVDLSGCGLGEETLRAFAGAHPEWQVCWQTELFGVSFSTLDEEICFDDIPLTVEDAAEIEALLPYMPNLKKVVMCRCGIADEDMETINLRHEDVQFVWMVQVRNYGVRTDRTYFCAYNCEYTYPDNNLSYAGLRYCHDMIALDLGHQKLYGDPDIFEGMPHLQYATLCDCAYEKLPTLSQLKDLIFLEMYWTNMDDITPLRELTNLKVLNITYKRIRDRDADLDVLSHMTWLEKLYFSGNMYSEEQVEALRKALPNTEIVVIYTLNCCSEGWRSENKYYYDYRDALHMYYISDDSNHIEVNPFTGEHSLYDDTDPFGYKG